MKMIRLRMILMAAFLFILWGAKTQDVAGLWEITKVEAGGQSMTPVAKWTRINADGTYQSGNGWLQNSEGSWAYNETTQEFLPKEKNGIKDEFGAFTVSFTDEGMSWSREEEGMKVTAHLERIDELPLATGDKITGLWGLEKAMEGEKDITASLDPEGKHHRFLRWDRIYVDRSPEGERQTGYWHIHGHKPEVTLLPHSSDKDAESWRVEVSESELRLTGISDRNKGRELVYSRLAEFPE